MLAAAGCYRQALLAVHLLILLLLLLLSLLFVLQGLLPDACQLRWLPLAAGGALWRAHPQAVEPSQLQGPGVTTRVHAGK
jgi:hypothetical protein